MKIRIILFPTILNLVALIMILTRSGECLSDRDKAYSHASSRAAKILEKEFGIHCCGTGCKTNEYIEMIALSFQVKQELSLDEARQLIVPIVQRYISILNTDTVLRPLMVKYPFDNENVEVVLFFMTKRNGDVFHPNMRVVSFNKSKFYFFSRDKNMSYRFVDDICETYEETLEKVRQHRLSPPI